MTQTAKKYIIPEDLAQAVLNYIGSSGTGETPFQHVNAMAQALMNLTEFTEDQIIDGLQEQTEGE